MTPRRDSKGGGPSRSQGGRSGNPQSSSQKGSSARAGASSSEAAGKGFSSNDASNDGRSASDGSRSGKGAASPAGSASSGNAPATSGAQSRFGAPALKASRTTPAGRKARSANGSGAKAIPDAVAQRMARRIALATGIPTLMGMGVFVGSYVLITQGIADIPPSATLLASGGCFLLGLLGLSYGVLSASWEEQPGSLLGREQIGLNINRLRASIRAMRQGGT